MSFVDGCLTVLLDSKRIAAIPNLPAGRRATVWWNYLRLQVRRLRRSQPGSLQLFDHRVAFQDIDNLLHLFREIHVRRLYDLPLEEPCPVIVDCGSNIGISVLFFKSRYPGATVLGFEPNPATHAILTENIESNGLSDVTAHAVALTDRPGSIELFVNPDAPGALNHGLYQGSQLTASTPVRAERLSSFIEGEVDLLKLDVEGAEELVISELAASGKLRSIRRIACEYHHHHHREAEADRLSVILGAFEENGFGYQIDAIADRSPLTNYQDVMIYAYRKDAADSFEPAEASVQAGTGSSPR